MQIPEGGLSYYVLDISAAAGDMSKSLAGFWRPFFIQPADSGITPGLIR